MINEEQTLVEKYKDKIKYYSHEDEKYHKGILSLTPESAVFSIKLLDTMLRNAIGKTDRIFVPLCSHQAILEREYPLDSCRVCNKYLGVVGVGRINDFLVLRHPRCRKPICFDCSKDNPDEFYKAFQKGLEKLEMMKNE